MAPTALSRFKRWASPTIAEMGFDDIDGTPIHPLSIEKFYSTVGQVVRRVAPNAETYSPYGSLDTWTCRFTDTETSGLQTLDINGLQQLLAAPNILYKNVVFRKVEKPEPDKSTNCIFLIDKEPAIVLSSETYSSLERDHEGCDTNYHVQAVIGGWFSYYGLDDQAKLGVCKGSNEILKEIEDKIKQFTKKEDQEAIRMLGRPAKLLQEIHDELLKIAGL